MQCIDGGAPAWKLGCEPHRLPVVSGRFHVLSRRDLAPGCVRARIVLPRGNGLLAALPERDVLWRRKLIAADVPRSLFLRRERQRADAMLCRFVLPCRLGDSDQLSSRFDVPCWGGRPDCVLGRELLPGRSQRKHSVPPRVLLCCRIVASCDVFGRQAVPGRVVGQHGAMSRRDDMRRGQYHAVRGGGVLCAGVLGRSHVP